MQDGGDARLGICSVLIDEEERTGCRRMWDTVTLVRSGRSERRADQRRKGLRAGLPHDGRAMVVDRALADAEIGGDVLAGMAGEDEVQDLPLTRRQTGNAASQPSPAMRTALAVSRV